MQVVVLILVNIIIATIFYLFIRLKLEKSATDYRVTRLRREMDQIIAEFNETAERNISILESKISILKGLLERSGQIKSVDINIDEIVKEKVIIKHNQKEIIEEKNKQNSYADVIQITKRININSQIKIIFFEIYNNYRNLIVKLSKKFMQTNQYYEIKATDDEYKKRVDINSDNNIIQKELIKQDCINEIDEFNLLSESEISDMFISNIDKYALIAKLHKEGYTFDILSKCSGIPQGEIKLVLDLNAKI